MTLQYWHDRPTIINHSIKCNEWITHTHVCTHTKAQGMTVLIHAELINKTSQWIVDSYSSLFIDNRTSLLFNKHTRGFAASETSLCIFFVCTLRVTWFTAVAFFWYHDIKLSTAICCTLVFRGPSCVHRGRFQITSFTLYILTYCVCTHFGQCVYIVNSTKDWCVETGCPSQKSTN